MSTIRPTDLDSPPLDSNTPLGGRPPPGRREITPAAPAAPETERVTLSRTTNVELTPFDEKRVEEMREAIAKGRAPFDPQRVAAALLDETLARFASKAPSER